jgi:hypothetical protein
LLLKTDELGLDANYPETIRNFKLALD